MNMFQSFRVGCNYTTVLAVVLFLVPLPFRLASANESHVSELDFSRDVAPIVQEHCSACHMDGGNEGSFSFDDLSKTENRHERGTQWYRVLKQLRADLMPPAEEAQPSEEQLAVLERWIKQVEFGIDPSASITNPGRVTMRRLNRFEYQNTIRDLLGVDYDTSLNFPADDTGHGFDNIGDVLSISPLLLEKYVNAAKEIASVIPRTSKVVRRQEIPGGALANEKLTASEGSRRLSYYETVEASATATVTMAGQYLVELNFSAQEQYQDNVFDLNSCQLQFSIDGEIVHEDSYVRQGGKQYSFSFEKNWEPGVHEFTVRVEPTSDLEQVRDLNFEI